jgi:hypothetical protein
VYGDRRSGASPVEFLAEFWLGVAGIVLSVTGHLPGWIFIPDGVLSILAAFVAGSNRQVANVIIAIALLLFIVGLITLARQ